MFLPRALPLQISESVTAGVPGYCQTGALGHSHAIRAFALNSKTTFAQNPDHNGAGSLSLIPEFPPARYSSPPDCR
jgi:hypothetical protein